jgi:cobalt-zinc-cadmium efflux system protein
MPSKPGSIVPHSHSHNVTASNPRLGLSIGLTLAFVVGEAVAGYFAHSLALMSDAGHNFSDALALILSWYGLQAAKRPATSRRTFGSHRVGILAALANALTLVAIGAIIIWEAIERFRDPQPVQGGPMIWVALVAMLLNGVISFWLHSGAKHDLNLRSAYLHMLGDAVSAFGVVVAGIIVAFTGSPLADPIVSLLIGGIIVWSSWGIITESVCILMEEVPKGVNMDALERSIKGVHGVLGVHDLHVWTVASGIHSASCHVLVSEQSIRSGEQILKAVAEMLTHDFAICHTTIQVEVEGCDADSLYCTMTPVGGHHHGHKH